MIQKTIFGEKIKVKKKETFKKRGPKVKKVSKPINEEILSMINRRERQILVHSYIYYELDENLIEDSVFDKWAKELAILKIKCPKEFRKSEFYLDFIDFDGSTGYNLNYRHPAIMNVAERLLKIREEENGTT